VPGRSVSVSVIVLVSFIVVDLSGKPPQETDRPLAQEGSATLTRRS
jgi:hypothetical protein